MPKFSEQMIKNRKFTDEKYEEMEESKTNHLDLDFDEQSIQKVV